MGSKEGEETSSANIKNIGRSEHLSMFNTAQYAAVTMFLEFRRKRDLDQANL